ncbi:hypothetical protein [Taibaiella sp. KBW10]|uniref:hypothetical protein n=1 Tax=Taibaiella sp. KBW10 TaxID=2153357 RepID=UPI000F59B51C|nr:hypothetical protein [Taibaiella sp. KBW10]
MKQICFSATKKTLNRMRFIVSASGKGLCCFLLWTTFSSCEQQQSCSCYTRGSDPQAPGTTQYFHDKMRGNQAYQWCKRNERDLKAASPALADSISCELFLRK